MKKKELKDLRVKSVAEINKILAKKQEELLKVTKDIIESKEKNVRRKRAVRHEIAQILTIKGIIETEKEL